MRSMGLRISLISEGIGGEGDFILRGYSAVPAGLVCCLCFPGTAVPGFHIPPLRGWSCTGGVSVFELLLFLLSLAQLILFLSRED